MVTRGIVGRLTRQLAEGEHPGIDTTCCINEIQRKRPCSICKMSCHVQALDKIAQPDFTKCDNCGICMAHCPTNAIGASRSFTQKLLELLENKDSQLILSCHQSDNPGDCSLSCLAAFPWEVFASLAITGNQLAFLSGDCQNCHHRQQMPLFDRSLSQLESFLGTEIYLKILSPDKTPRLQSRREAFNTLFRQGRRSATSLLPEELRGAQDPKLWRKILLHRLASQDSSQTPAFREASFQQKIVAHWIAPIIEPDCRACGICEKTCPNKALQVVAANDNHFYMAHFGWKCQGCGICAAVCPWKNIKEFGLVAMEKADKPFVTLTEAKPCIKCKAPCHSSQSLCMECAATNRS
ncbi:MAG: 4Fe-4S binding protein [Spirochaetaceae bacterium]|nr:4Fe-4S binding protein [Spirochaetaceae bacterium]